MNRRPLPPPRTPRSQQADHRFMRLAVRLAQRGYGRTSPNPLVGAVLVRAGRIIGRGWHERAGEPHAEINALRDAAARDHATAGATLYVTLEPCCTQGRTPPCTSAIVAAGIKRVVAAATDPHPAHCGLGFRILRDAGIEVVVGVLAEDAIALNAAFNHWIVQGTPWVTVKAAMTLDGKIATAGGESRWITAPAARAHAMRLRLGADGILVGINTVLADDPSLTARTEAGEGPIAPVRQPRRIVLDALARTPLTARLVKDADAGLTTIVVSRAASKRRIKALSRRVRILVAPARAGRIDLRWLLQRLGREQVTDLLVEGGGEVQAAFLEARLAHRVAFFYAPVVLGGVDAPRAVAGLGAADWNQILDLRSAAWRRLGPDLLLTARVESSRRRATDNSAVARVEKKR